MYTRHNNRNFEIFTLSIGFYKVRSIYMLLLVFCRIGHGLRLVAGIDGSFKPKGIRNRTRLGTEQFCLDLCGV